MKKKSEFSQTKSLDFDAQSKREYIASPQLNTRLHTNTTLWTVYMIRLTVSEAKESVLLKTIIKKEQMKYETENTKKLMYVQVFNENNRRLKRHFAMVGAFEIWLYIADMCFHSQKSLVE